MEDKDLIEIIKMMSANSYNNYPREAITESYVQGCKDTRIEFVESIIGFFKLEYSLGKQIMELMRSDKDNQIIAFNMLISSAKDSIKNIHNKV
jgi:hypothetical protein